MDKPKTKAGTPPKYYKASHRGIEKELTANEWSLITIQEYEISVGRLGKANSIKPSKPKTISRRQWMHDHGRASYTPQQIVGLDFIHCTHKKQRIRKEIAAKEPTLMDKFLRKSLVPIE